MPEPSSESSPAAYKFIQDRVATTVVFGFQILTAFCFALIPILAYNWLRTPFMGVFVEHTLFVNTASPTQVGSWALNNLDLPFGYQLANINGTRVRTAQEIMSVLQQYQPGDTVAIDLAAPDGELMTVPIRLARFPAADQLTYLIIPYLTGLVYLLCSVYVFSVRRRDAAGRAFALFAASTALGIASLFDTYTTHRLTYLWTLTMGFSAGALLNLAVLFPQEVRLVKRFPFLRWAGYIPTLILVGMAFPTLFNFSRPVDYVIAWRYEFIYLAIAMVFFLGMSVYRYLRSLSPVAREQSRLILFGSLVAFGPLGVWLVVASTNPSINFSSGFLLPLVFFPVVIGYAILRYRLLNTDYLLNRTLLYGLLSVLGVVTYALLVSGIGLLLGNVLPPNSPYLIGLMVFLVALLLDPVRTRLQAAVDATFFRGQMVYRNRLQTFGRELTQAMELPGILRLLRSYAYDGLLPSQMHIFVHDALSDHYVAAPDPNGQVTTDIRFPAGSALVQVMKQRRDSIFLTVSNPEEGSAALLDALPDALQSERARLGLLGCQLFVPLPGRQGLIGWLALGPRRSGEPYTSRDLSFLESLSDQAALAVERAQVVADLERRVREMNVLTRVAQGINFTLSFDDILELIYAQTNQVIATRDFRITLYDELNEALYYAFYLENDERLVERERHPLPRTRGLEAEVVSTQRPLLTDDYERACRARNFLPETQGLYAWMGVPMNAGARTIGALSLGSRDPAIFFTEEQRNLLQAIADQASGAIVKARLLEETERRARQLATLNEIGRSLTSTLELRPLLGRILKSATEILNCEAGSLFLVDEQTGELVFEVVIGPVASNLTGRRLPPGTGLVGEAVENGRAIIANDAKRRKEWSDKPDMQTGFDTQDILVVPMQVQDRIIGAIEVINKVSGAPFDAGDQELLTTFSSQATIAIENARLYTLTDQALAARVEELSVMQRIDRELNASLNVERAMRITLDWAMRRSGLEAGLVGIVTEAKVNVVVAQGYPDALAQYRRNGDGDHNRRYLPEDLPALQQALATGQPQAVSLAALAAGNGAAAAGGHSLLLNACLQVVIPIQREADVIGVLLMESTQTEMFAEETMAFLSRLADHAAIAIANAQLYGEVEAANLAKSKFVSFVAHELKNPMTVIKGNTELVASGMAGAINELQASFLATVRSNVDRMNTIVSDLNDLTKIQVGSLRLEYKAVQMKESVDEVIRSLRRQIEDRHQQLILEVPDNLPLVWADQGRLTQILLNLVSNAQKYTPEGGAVTVGAERQVVSGDAPAGLEVVHLWVRDTGIGIPAADQDKIFQSYFRTEISKETASGTGLGLNITRSLVEMQGGRIWFESEVGKGTTFHFTVPIAETA